MQVKCACCGQYAEGERGFCNSYCFPCLEQYNKLVLFKKQIEEMEEKHRKELREKNELNWGYGALTGSITGFILGIVLTIALISYGYLPVILGIYLFFFGVCFVGAIEEKK